MKIIRAIFVIALLVGSVGAQTSQSCSDLELRLSVTKAQLAAERVRAETGTAQQQSLRNELEQIRRELIQEKGTVEQRLSIKRGEISVLRGALAEVKEALNTKDRIIVELTMERDQARQETRRARKRTVWAVIAASALGVFGVLK